MYGYFHYKIRRSGDSLVFIMGIPTLVRQHPYFEKAFRMPNSRPIYSRPIFNIACKTTSFLIPFMWYCFLFDQGSWLLMAWYLPDARTWPTIMRGKPVDEHHVCTGVQQIDWPLYIKSPLPNVLTRIFSTLRKTYLWTFATRCNTSLRYGPKLFHVIACCVPLPEPILTYHHCG